MIRQDGSIHFAEEIMALVDGFLEDYRDIEGNLPTGLDRGLVIAYVFGSIRCDLELLNECLEKQPIFGNLPPQQVLDECSAAYPDRRAQRRAEILRMLLDQGWLPLESE